MKSKYFSLWLLLASALLIICIIAFADDFSIFGLKVKKAPIVEALTIPHESDEQREMRLAREAQLVEQKAKALQIPVDSTPQNFLIFGDSMSENIALRLAAYARQNGHSIHTVNWDSSGTRIWANSDTLAHFIRKYQPTYIFVTLGSNESFVRNVDNFRPYVRKIRDDIGDIPFVWIGPPAFKEEHGFNEMLLAELPRGTFFRADGLKLERRKDKIHPTVKAAAYEVDSLVRWMRHSAHPIRMDFPADSIADTRISQIGITYLKARH